MAEEADAPDRLLERVFLVVADETEEMSNALRFAGRRAQHSGGRVALLAVVEPADLGNWLGVGQVIEDDQRRDAETLLHRMAEEAYRMTGKMPILHLREGDRREEVVKLLQEDKTISLLVLGTAKGSSPGPIVTYLMSHLGSSIRIPVTLVPGDLTPEEIDQVT
ncbi:MAG TPA: universal stress protein [Geminicoccus sp.]|uniref:universal stress protein n=1 Tax=Geminicoccus sp. TaxID=2024832 RepID=UPI002CB45CED|nr:universal stress protein [Geminicoccus sp.]HWL69725.1 universal stress protein [Geminicoccus sp.]